MPLVRHLISAIVLTISVGSIRCSGQRPVRLPSIHSSNATIEAIEAIDNQPVAGQTREFESRLVDLVNDPLDSEDSTKSTATEDSANTQPVVQIPKNTTSVATAAEFGALDFDWWAKGVSQPLGVFESSLPIRLDQLIDVSLDASPHISAILTQPSIKCREIAIADAEFDTAAFIESRFADTHDPIGSLLTTGNNANRFRDETFSSVGGLKRRSRYGGSVELAQTIGTQANNSTFLIPNPQSTTRLEVNFTQPLMRNRGRMVNTARVSLARLDTRAATYAARQDVETHLVRVAQAYWELYSARAEYIQRSKLVSEAVDIVARLQRRSSIDTAKRQILRAEVDLARREARLVRLRARIMNAQAELRSLTGDSRFVSANEIELLPAEVPLETPVLIEQSEATAIAIQQRADIAESMQSIRAVSIKVGAAKNQMLPKLDLILSSYIAGLDSRSRGFDAFADQFSRGRPSYAAGLAFEIPVGNRSSRARAQREQLELNRAVYEFEQTTADAITEVEIALRNLEASKTKADLTRRSILAARREVDYLERRFKMLPDPNESSVVLMEDLLDAQSRLADEELALVNAQVQLALGHLELRRAIGVLVQLDDARGNTVMATYNSDPRLYHTESEFGDTIVFDHLPVDSVHHGQALENGMIDSTPNDLEDDRDFQNAVEFERN